MSAGPVWIVVSARMASARCPGKALAPLAGRPLLEVLLERMADVRFDPGYAPREADRVIGRRAGRPIQADETILEDMLE